MRARKRVANTCRGPDLKTEQSWQAYFLKFWKHHKVEPHKWLGNGDGYVEIEPCYAIDVIAGNNIRMNELCAQSVKEYLKSVNNLFSSCGFSPPINSDPKTKAPALFTITSRFGRTNQIAAPTSRQNSWQSFFIEINKIKLARA